jgi:hypothetical protein
MDASMDVGVMMAFVVVDRIDDEVRTLARGAIVEIHQGLAVDDARKDREVAPHGVYVESRFHR